MNRQIRRRTFGAWLTASTLAGPVLAQGYPTKAVTLIVPFAPGGSSDSIARALAVDLAPRLGQPVIVENRPGAGGTLAAAYVARANPDGHTLLFVTASHSSAKALYPGISYDPEKSFEAIVGLAAYPVAILVKPDSRYQTLADLVADLRARPGKLNSGNPGTATVPGLSASLFRNHFKLDFTNVTYKGSSPTLVSAMSGETDFVFTESGSIVPLVKGGKLRVLAVMDAARLPALPQAPSVDETEMKGFHTAAWLGMLAPKGTAADLVARLNREIVAIVSTPAWKERFESTGGAGIFGSPEKFSEMLASETQRWTRTITDLGIKAE